MKTTTKRRLWGLGLVLAFVAVAASGVYLALVPVQRVEVVGVRHAFAQEIARLSGVTLGERLLGTDDALVEDRVVRHPWVQSAVATRLPNGVVRIRVQERTPVALVLDADGRAKAYLDGAGHAMPVVQVLPYDLPLVHGRVLPANLTQPAPLPAVRELAASLAALPADAQALVSDFSVDPRGDVTLRTVAAPSGDALRVRLGRTGYDAKFDALVRFWHHAVLPRPTRRYDVLDLRFAGQIVTREANRGDALPDSARADSLLRVRRAKATRVADSLAAARREAAAPKAPSASAYVLPRREPPALAVPAFPVPLTTP